MPKESIWLAAVSIASPTLMEKTQPSSWAEVSALSAVTLPGSLSLKVPTDRRLWPQMQFCEDKRLWTAALKTPASVPHMLDNVEDAVKVRVQESCDCRALRTKSTYRQGKCDFFKTRPAILGQDQVVGHVGMWLHHGTLQLRWAIHLSSTIITSSWGEERAKRPCSNLLQ